MRFMVDDLILEIRAWLDQPGNSKAKLARLAELHRNTVLNCDRDGWNPTLEVVRKVEDAIRGRAAA